MLHCNQCGGEWESRKIGVLPIQCPRCKRCDWHMPKKGVGDGERVGASDVGGKGSDTGGDAGGGNLEGLAVSFLRTSPVPEKRLHTVPEVRGELVGGDGPDQEPPREACSYREYDPETGEWYGCALELHGPKIKHVRGGTL